MITRGLQGGWSLGFQRFFSLEESIFRGVTRGLQEQEAFLLLPDIFSGVWSRRLSCFWWKLFYKYGFRLIR